MINQFLKRDSQESQLNKIQRGYSGSANQNAILDQTRKTTVINNYSFTFLDPERNRNEK